MHNQVDKQIKEVDELFPGMIDRRYSNHWGPGWHKHLLTMFAQLVALDVTCDQVKEKFGRLCVYFNYGDATPEQRTKARALLDEYAELLDTACYKCGTLDSKRANHAGWYVALCDNCDCENTRCEHCKK